MTSAAATVMRRRRTYSDSGMPANDENIRRRWYSVVPRLARQAADVDLLGEVLLDEVDEPVEHCDHGVPLRDQASLIGSTHTRLSRSDPIAY